MHECVCACKMARHREHYADGLFSDSDCVRSRRIHHRNTRAGSGFQVDIVHADPGTPNDPQFLGVLQQIAIHLHGRTDDQRIRGLQLRREISVQLLRVTTSHVGSRNRSVAREDIFSAMTTFMFTEFPGEPFRLLLASAKHFVGITLHLGEAGRYLEQTLIQRIAGVRSDFCLHVHQRTTVRRRLS